jgi:hypothetical protein
MVPDVFVHPKGVHPGEPVLVSGHRGQQRSDPGPQGPPGDPELAGQTGHAGVLPTQLPHRPPGGPGGHLRPGRGEVFVLLGERPDRAGNLRAGPGPFAPPQPHRAPEARGVDDLMGPPTVRDRDHPADRAAHRAWRRLDRDDQPGTVPVHGHHVVARQPDQQVAAVAVRPGAGWARQQPVG